MPTRIDHIVVEPVLKQLGQARRSRIELVVTGADGKILRRDSDGGDPSRRPG